MANQNFKVKKGLEVGTGTTVSVDGINVTGVITATTFAGDGSALTGVTAAGSGVVVQEEGSNIGTAATINFIGSNVTAALSGGIANVTVAGGGDVVTDTTPQLGGNLDLNSKNISGTGNIDITGYAAVSGVATFSQNVTFESAASFGDNDKANFGAGNDLQIFHDGTSNIISDAVGAGISLVGNTKVVGVLTATSFSGSLATTDLTGTITNAQLAGSISNDKLAGSIADGKLASTFLKNVVEDTTPQLGGNLDGNNRQITGIGTVSIDTSLSVAGLSTFDGIGLFPYSKTLNFGSNTSQEGQLYATSEYFYINSSADNGVFVQTDGFIKFNRGTSSGDFIVMNSHPNHSGEVSLFYNNSKKLETTNTGVTVTGTLAATAVTGDGSGLTDLTGASAGTYGASTNTPIITVDSNGRITGIATVATSGAGGGGGISNIIEDTTPQLGGNLDLNSKTINGTGNIDITGYAAVSGVTTFSGIAGFTTHITLPDNAEIQIGGATGGDLKIYHDGSNSYIQDAGTGDLRLDTNLFRVRNAAGSESMIVASNDGAVSLYHDNALRLTTTDAGVSITDNLRVAGISTFVGSVDLSSGADIPAGASLDFGTDFSISRFSNQNKARIQYTGPGTFNFEIDDIDFRNDANNRTLMSLRDGGAVSLFHNNGAKLVTTSTGVTVTGTLAATAVTGDGSGLTGLPAAGITTANTNIQATWAVTSNGASAYRFTGPGNDAADDNPDLYLVRGQRYRFTNNSGGSHPFQIRSSPGGSAYSTGVTNNGGASGNIDFNVQHDAPERLYYQCTSHSGMVGNIYIVGGSDWRMTNVAANATPEIFTNLNVGIGTILSPSKVTIGSVSSPTFNRGALAIKAMATDANCGTSGIYIEESSTDAGQGEGYNITVDADGNLKFHNSGAAAPTVTFADNDNVGIGTANPGDNLEIKTDAHGEGLTVKSTGSTSNAVTFDANRSGGGQSISNVYGRWNGTTVAQMGFVTGVDATNKNDGYIYFGTESDASNGNVNATERMRIDSNGRVSIGQTVSLADYNAFTNGLVVKRGGINEGITIDCSNQGGLFFSNGTGSGEFKGQLIYYHTTDDHSMRMLVNGGEKLRILQGGGITFNGDTAAANALDDYEEGTFTATCANGVTLYSSNDVCQYVKIGAMVTVMGQVRVNSSNGNSSFVINNLPFAAMTAAEGSGLSAGSVRLYAVDMASDHKYIVCVAGSGTDLEFQAIRDNTAAVNISATDGGYFLFNSTYRTNA